MKSAAQKHSGFAPMLKNVFRRNILSMILSPLFTLSITILVIIDMLSLKPTETQDITDVFSLIVSSLLAVFSAIIALIFVYTMYRELFSRRASDFLLAMPVKREAYYNANFLFVLINIILCFAIPFAASLFLIKSNLVYPAKFYVLDVAYFAKFMLIALFATVAILALFVVSAVISGRKWHYFVISYFILSCGFRMAMGLTSYVNTIWGFVLERDYSFIVSPYASLLYSADDRIKNIVPILAALAAQVAIAYAAGLIAFKRRKAEVAETTVSGKILPFVIITAFLLANVFAFFSLDANIVVSVVIEIIAMAIAVIIITALFYRKAFNKLTLTSLITSVVITIMVVLCVELTPKATGYVDYIPEASEVESVTVEVKDNFITMPVSMGFITDLLESYYDDGLGMYDEFEHVFNLSTDEAKDAVSALHKTMISDKAQSKGAVAVMFDGYDAANNVRLKYKLKNGKTVTRSYTAYASLASDAFADVLQTDECLNQISPVNFGKDVLFLEISPYLSPIYEDEMLTEETAKTDDISYSYLKLDDFSAFLECVKKDLKKTDYVYTLLTENGFSPEYYKEWNDEMINFGERKDAVCTITFYKFKADAPKEEKAKMIKMSPEDMQAYDEKRVQDSDYELEYLLDSFSYSFAKSDNNTIKYLKSKGYKY
ncbi:MAG: ABC transporter permease [Eubacterium sp.]|nr:ABC transporter permease [Eubacterium sp.]